MSTYCHLCKEDIDVELNNLARSHLKWGHNVSAREYYDRFLSPDGGGMCVICSGQTNFISITYGYKRACGSRTCGAALASRNLMEVSGVTNVSQLLHIKKKKVETCMKHYGHPTHLMNEDVKKDIKKSCMTKYGTDNPSKNIEVVAKRKNTIMERYGKDSYAKTLDFRQTQEALGIWTPIENKSDFEIYRMLVWRETNKWKKSLFELWDGTCFYTQQKLVHEKECFNDPLYATVDHKTSIFLGFKHGVSPEEIGHMDNLCICSRSANSIKKTKSEKQFRKFLES